MRITPYAILLFVSILIVSCNTRKVETTLYLKGNDGSVTKVSDCKISIINKDTLNKILKLREDIKAQYACALVSNEQLDKLKNKGYQGPLHPDEIDYVIPFADILALALNEDSKSILSDFALSELTGGMSNNTLLNELKIDWSQADSSTANLIRIQQFLKAEIPASKAADIGKKALEIISKESLGTFKTNLEGNTTIEIPKDSFLWMSCMIEGHFISWLIPSSEINDDKHEINQSSAFIIKRIPQSVAELHDELATMKFFYTETSFGESNALPASIMSDEFYHAATKSLGLWNDEDWKVKFKN